MMQQTMKQYQLSEVGGQFELVDVPMLQIEADDEVRLQIKAVGLNPADNLQWKYGALVSQWPAVLGFDGAGVIESVGKDCKHFKAGDEVFGAFGIDSLKAKTFQEYAVIKEMYLAPKPKSMSFEDAASLGSGYGTAAAAVMDLGIKLPWDKDEKGQGSQPESILVLGGSGVVGAAVVQLLHIVTPGTPILATSSSKNHEQIRKLGANPVDRNSQTLVEDIRAASLKGAGVDSIVDCVSGLAVQSEILQSLNPNGSKKVVEVLTWNMLKNAPSDIDHVISSETHLFASDGRKDAMPFLGALLSSGKWILPVKPTVMKTKGWGALEGGLHELAKGVSGTKLIVTL